MRKSIGIYQPKEYEIDYDKVKTVEDVVGILKALNISIWDNAGGLSLEAQEIKHLLLLKLEVDR